MTLDGRRPGEEMQKMYDGAGAGREARIFAIVTELLSKRELPTSVGAEQPLYDAGLSSLDLVNLMLAVEVEFDLEIPQHEITPENFRSVAAIGRLVESLAVAA
jgi:acyl carrier protein